MTIEIRLNGEPQALPASWTVLQLLEHFGLPLERVAVERNRSIVPKTKWESVSVSAGDEIEVVHFVGGGEPDGSLVIAGKTFQSRLLVGTGKYPSHPVMKECHERSGTGMVTVAVRRIDLKAAKGESLLDYIDRSRIAILPNTAACYTVDEAVRTARLGREAGLSHWVKLEVIGDEQTLFPDTAALIEATRILVKEGFVVLPYTNDDLVVALRLIDAGASAIMPLGAPIGSGMGNPEYSGDSNSSGKNHRSSIDSGRRCRYGVRCRTGHGTRCRWRTDEQRHCRLRRSRGNGRSDEFRCESRPSRIYGGANPTPPLRFRLVAARRSYSLAQFAVFRSRCSKSSLDGG